jgi:HAD superfamily hydrolase (TIGR01509 family)
MDGVLIDSLSLSLTVCNQILAQHFGESVQVSDALIREIFAYHIPEFWRRILLNVADTYQLNQALTVLDSCQQAYQQARQQAQFPLNHGIIDILQAAQNLSLPMAVVSNNPTEEVRETLQAIGIAEYFQHIIGNDLAICAKKPAPDSYLLAADYLAIDSSQAVVIEDSLIGVEAGYRAGAYTIAVATGGTDYALLANSGYCRQCYQSFAEPQLNLAFGDVRDKKMLTPNDFVTHAIEHIAWRLGVKIQLTWLSDDWLNLGKFLGSKIAEFSPIRRSCAILGMIDDGSAEVSIDLDQPAQLQLTGIDTLDLAWFLNLRCEQLANGQPLVSLMQGLALGLSAELKVNICSVQDPHHTWEGVFRAIGISLSQLFMPPITEIPFDQSIEWLAGRGELQILAKSLHYSQVFRGTAESHVKVSVDFSRQQSHHFIFNVSPTINVSELPKLLILLAEQAGFSLQVEYQATVLNSSHVVLEDTALVLGRALLEILKLRMMTVGVNGAGSSLRQIADQDLPLQTGISVEGRKFWLFVPFNTTHEVLRREFLMGQTIEQHLRSEDLDDFLDGLAGGLGCSIIVHVHRLISADEGWQLIFKQLGQCLQQVFATNPYRQGVPPGVKATLA